MKLHISQKVFTQIIKKGYNLDLIYLLKLIDAGIDISPMYEESMKISNLYDGLIRKGLLSRDDEKLTLEAKDLIDYIKSEETDVDNDSSPPPLTIVKRKPLVTDFEEWWKNYPLTDSFTYKNKNFKGTRALRRGKSQCKSKFEAIINEGDYTAQQLIKALEYEVKLKLEASLKENKNNMRYMQGSLTYLNQRTFESFIELAEQADNITEQKTGPVDI